MHALTFAPALVQLLEMFGNLRESSVDMPQRRPPRGQDQNDRAKRRQGHHCHGKSHEQCASHESHQNLDLQFVALRWRHRASIERLQQFGLLRKGEPVGDEGRQNKDPGQQPNSYRQARQQADAQSVTLQDSCRLHLQIAHAGKFQCAQVQKCLAQVLFTHDLPSFRECAGRRV